jgi:hypothetical protein
MANAATNIALADAHIVTHYPEIANIEDTLDAIAAVGRTLFTLTLEDKDHGTAIADSLELTLVGLGYVIKASQTIVTVAIPAATS